MKSLYLFALLLLITSCKTKEVVLQVASTSAIKKEIHTHLDAWHQAAAEANYDAYFNLMTKDGVFIGTDATENWQNEAFKTFSKPYFEKGKAWSFSAIERNVYVSQDKKIAWFDELLDTQMKICRGSGVMKLEDNTWKVAHYVLSIAIPNENVKEVVALKNTSDSLYIKSLRIKNTQ
ncbi:nuclear transport factor 2 family protein [Lacinutrix sp. C3R15]|uniref:nuclear transport factor 2 family protein n=1 Tax=Flavobacteriaceae TaxID=49546 RepID=UPI001C0A4A7D|nr:MULTISPECIES: nuclear transport factor 2 family protein [Flavobacteriaceae]MBU2938225.1 nuclear transport factor 2 family protein [Lacinutrix sp. C3R15]MDO6621539.1 nuclear transport factor 2 family protein [Oceanihabitans sp. 1_MG-2023]